MADEELASRIARDDTAGLSDEQRAALRYADAHMTGPKRIDDELRSELRQSFTAGQLVELSLDVSAWNAQKVPVALEVDAAVDARGTSALTFDETGRFHVAPPT